MARRQNTSSHYISDSAAALPPGEWILRRGIRVFVPAIPPVQFASACHCGDYYADLSCETCIQWAEKNARLHAEAQQSWANRGRIWDILELRRQVAA